MKKALLTALALGVSVTFAANGYAVDTKAAKDRAAWTADANHVESKKIIGMRVNGPDGKRIGEIDQIIVDTKAAKITHVVLGIGGMAGVGETRVVVPWSQLKMMADSDNRDRMVAVIDRATLDSAPRYSARADRDGVPAASPRTDKDRDGTPNVKDRAPSDPTRK